MSDAPPAAPGPFGLHLDQVALGTHWVIYGEVWILGELKLHLDSTVLWRGLYGQRIDAPPSLTLAFHTRPAHKDLIPIGMVVETHDRFLHFGDQAWAFDLTRHEHDYQDTYVSIRMHRSPGQDVK